MSVKTQHEKIISLFIRMKGLKEWFYPYDFMTDDLGDNFVGYEATARLSEVTRKFPLMFEVKNDGKYKVRRFRFEAIPALLNSVSQDWRNFIIGELNKNCVEYQIIQKVPIHNEENNSVRLVDKLVNVNKISQKIQTNLI